MIDYTISKSADNRLSGMVNKNDIVSGAVYEGDISSAGNCLRISDILVDYPLYLIGCSHALHNQSDGILPQ